MRDRPASARNCKIPDAAKEQDGDQRVCEFMLKRLESLMIPKHEVVKKNADHSADRDGPNDLGKVKERLAHRPEGNEEGWNEVGADCPDHKIHDGLSLIMLWALHRMASIRFANRVSLFNPTGGMIAEPENGSQDAFILLFIERPQPKLPSKLDRFRERKISS